MTFVKELEKLFKPQNIVIIIGVIIVGVALCHYTDKKNMTQSGFSDQVGMIAQDPNVNAAQLGKQVRSVQSAGAGGSPVPNSSIAPDAAAPVNSASTSSLPTPPPNCTNQPTLNPADLLPKTSGSGGSNSWAALQVPVGSGGAAESTTNFLDSSFLAGINTVSGSLRNANLQLRSEPPNPTNQVSPWLQTTIEPDLMRAPFEIGCACPGKTGL